MIPAALVNIVIVAAAILATPGRTNGLVMLSWIFGLLFAIGLSARSWLSHFGLSGSP